MTDMKNTSDEDGWAQLVCLTDTDTPPFVIGKNKFTVGRLADCDISHENNRHVSSIHCYIQRDEFGKVWLYDNSTNGTLLNEKIKMTKGECREIVHGDEFFIVYKKGQKDFNIGYVYQDLEMLRKEEREDEELDQTLEYDTDISLPLDNTTPPGLVKEEEKMESKCVGKRKLDMAASEFDPDCKRVKVKSQWSSDTVSKNSAKESDTSTGSDVRNEANITRQVEKLPSPRETTFVTRSKSKEIGTQGQTTAAASNKMRKTPSQENAVNLRQSEETSEQREATKSASCKVSSISALTNANLIVSSKTKEISSQHCTTTPASVNSRETTLHGDTTSLRSKPEEAEIEATKYIEQIDKHLLPKTAFDSGSQISAGDTLGRVQNKKATEKEDVFADSLACIICQDLLHDCISLQPCMHSFCAGCYSVWMANSKECPSCRMHVDRISKNHIINNLVEAYIKEHPEKRRPEEDIKELDAKNKITRDMLYPKSTRKDSSEYSDSEETDSSSSSSSSLPAPVTHSTIFGFGTPFWGSASNVFKAICRQCPNSTLNVGSDIITKALNAVKTYVTGTNPAQQPVPVANSHSSSSDTGNSNNNNLPSTSEAADANSSTHTGDPQSDSDQKIMPSAPAYQCTGNQNHVMCQCCLQIFPDRRNERLQNPDLPPQQCTICYRAYCHAYWGCRRADCNGCLAKFKDLSFGKKVLPGLILENPYESEILKNYLVAKGLSVRNVLETCITKMEAGTYTCPDQAAFNITGDTPLCFGCGLRNFKALAYLYRYDIAPDQLPVEVTARPDCYWGKNCRTQRNKLTHAQRFNHICNQIRS